MQKNPEQQSAINYFQSKDLVYILTKAKTLDALNQKIKPFLPDVCRKQCQVANVIKQKLILLVSNGSIGMILKYQTSDLVLTFSKHPELAFIKEIDIKVRPKDNHCSVEKAPEPLILSKASAQLIEQTANNINNQSLKEILLQLAKRGLSSNTP